MVKTKNVMAVQSNVSRLKRFARTGCDKRIDMGGGHNGEKKTKSQAAHKKNRGSKHESSPLSRCARGKEATVKDNKLLQRGV